MVVNCSLCTCIRNDFYDHRMIIYIVLHLLFTYLLYFYFTFVYYVMIYNVENNLYFKHTRYFGRLHMSEIFSSKTLNNRKTHIYTLYFVLWNTWVIVNIPVIIFIILINAHIQGNKWHCLRYYRNKMFTMVWYFGLYVKFYIKDPIFLFFISKKYIQYLKIWLMYIKRFYTRICFIAC